MLQTTPSEPSWRPELGGFSGITIGLSHLMADCALSQLAIFTIGRANIFSGKALYSSLRLGYISGVDMADQPRDDYDRLWVLLVTI